MANSISEWFGHRVFPEVCGDAGGIEDQKSERCPFLSESLGTTRKCIKSINSRGVCTVSSLSDGRQRDWVVCPYRTLNSQILNQTARRLFCNGEEIDPLLIAAPTLGNEATRSLVAAALRKSQRVVVFFMDKLGGEIDVPGTRRSPKFKLDTTLVEINRSGTKASIGRHGILEVQTMDFHGSYRLATQSLRHALELHPVGFPTQLKENPNWASVGIQTPNIANVFKRTIYQILFKFQLGHHPDCAGAVLALPGSVWDSWQPHLGAPTLKTTDQGTTCFSDSKATGPTKGWILVFEVDDMSTLTPNPVRVANTIEADWETLAHLAFERAPEESMQHLLEKDALRTIIRRRIGAFWPELFDCG